MFEIFIFESGTVLFLTALHLSQSHMNFHLLNSIFPFCSSLFSLQSLLLALRQICRGGRDETGDGNSSDTAEPVQGTDPQIEKQTGLGSVLPKPLQLPAPTR